MTWSGRSSRSRSIWKQGQETRWSRQWGQAPAGQIIPVRTEVGHAAPIIQV